MSEEFGLFDVEVHVFKHDGVCEVKDWNRKDLDDARTYAEEVAYFEDVVKTIFRDSEAESDVVILNDDLFEQIETGKYRSKEDGEIITFQCELTT
tara:strand:- start:546 stop:830 length:285 start_codon:yes stop_codon:yes gene_type:complete